jgi:hypothetical protein
VKRIMAELSHWKDVIVVQRNLQTGCIPTGYEWMIKYLGIEKVDFCGFQDEFDFLRRVTNSFETIKNGIGFQGIEGRYPHIMIKIKNDFANGLEKVSYIRGLIEKDIPCLISIAPTPQGRWHCPVVVYVDDIKMRVIWSANETGNQVCEFTTRDIASRHDNWCSGKDSSWIEK